MLCYSKLIEMVKVRNNNIVVALGNIEKTYYDRVNKKTFFSGNERLWSAARIYSRTDLENLSWDYDEI